MDGGKHERGMRSGTLNVPGIVSLGKACDLARLEMKPIKKSSLLRNKLEQSILSKLENTSVNGGNAPRLAHVTNIAFGGVDGEMLLGNLKISQFPLVLLVLQPLSYPRMCSRLWA
jgi:cysteine desulfurase